MTRKLADGNDLEFDFSDCPEEDVIDLDDVQQLAGGARCDYLVFTPFEPSLMIEVKDPCCPAAVDARRRQLLHGLKIEPEYPTESQLFNKIEPTVAYKEEVRPERKRFVYIIVLGFECIEGLFDRSVVGPMQTNILRRIKSVEHLKQTIRKVRLVSVAGWNKSIPQYSLRRLSAN